MHTHTHARAHTQTFKTESFDDGSVRLLYDLGVQVTDRDNDELSQMNEAHT